MAQTMPIERKLVYKAGAITTIRCQNKGDIEVEAGDVVVLDTANSSATNICFKLSNTADDIDVLGMAIQTIANDEYGEIQIEGPTSLLRVDGTSDLAAGDELSVIAVGSFADYAIGDMNLAVGGTTVTDGTGSTPTWTDAMVGAKFIVDGETTSYRITAKTSSTEFEITPAYRGSTALTNKAYNITYKGRAAEATAGKGGAFATVLEAYTTNNSAGVIDAVIHYPARVDTTVTGNTLDAAYDEGGAGAGRAIAVNGGAVDLNGAEASNNILEISNGAGTGSLIDLALTTTSAKDIDGTGSSWSVTGAGAMAVASLNAGSGAIATTGDISGANITASGTITGTIASASWANPTLTGTVTVSGATTFATTATFNGNVTLGASETLTITGVADTTVLTVTAGDVVITDGAVTISNTDDTTTMVTLDHSGGAIASGSEVLKLDDGGNTAAGASMLSIEPTGTPVEASFGIHFVGAGKVMQAMNIDCDSATNSCVLINSGGGLSADKAVVELTCDAGLANGASMLYIHSTTAATATAYGVEIKCDAANLEGLWVSAGTSKFDEAILLADGAAATPSLRFSSDADTGIFWAATYIGFAVAGAAEMQIAANLVTIGAAANLQFTTSTTGILDGAGLQLLTFTHTATAVNEFVITNAATGGAPRLSVAGDDTDITMQLLTKGDAGVNIASGTAGDAARPDIHLQGDADTGFYGGTNIIGIATAGTARLSIDATGNLLVHGATAATSAQGCVHLLNATAAPTGNLANGIVLYSAAGELNVRDAAGNTTVLSPHNEDGDYIIASYSEKKGKTLKVNLEKLCLRLAEKFPNDFADLVEVAEGQAV